MSKGSTPRPFDVTQEEFANRFDAIFKKPKPEPARCAHPTTYAKEADDISVMRCTECDAKLPWLYWMPGCEPKEEGATDERT